MAPTPLDPIGAAARSSSIPVTQDRAAGFAIYGARRTVEAVAATKELAQLLYVTPGHPLLLVTSVSWGKDQRCFDYYTSWRDVAMVFQNYALYPHLTVYENMAFCLRVRRVPKERMDQQVKRVATSLGIGDLLHRKPSELSGGQRQRVALGRAVVREPRVFLMDEPLSNLDAKLRIEMRAEIVKLCRRLNVTTFYVTHDQLEAMTMGHRIVVMQGGKVQQIDTPQGIFDAPVNQFVAGFIGSPPMNFLRGTTSADGAVLEGPGFRLHAGERLAQGLRGTAVAVVGIRPEHLRPATGKTTEAGWIQGRIEVIEPLGSEVMVQLAVGEATVVAQFRRGTSMKIGEELRLEQEEPGILHAFDAETGRSALRA